MLICNLTAPEYHIAFPIVVAQHVTAVSMLAGCQIRISSSCIKVPHHAAYRTVSRSSVST